MIHNLCRQYFESDYVIQIERVCEPFWSSCLINEKTWDNVLRRCFNFNFSVEEGFLHLCD